MACKLPAVEAIVLGPGVAPRGEGPRLVGRIIPPALASAVLRVLDVTNSADMLLKLLTFWCCHFQLSVCLCVERSYLANQRSEGQGTAFFCVRVG